MGPTSSRSGRATNDDVSLYWTLTEPAHGSGGEPAPLLLVNGLGSPLVAFEPGFVALLVERGLAVARFDNRDVGRSDRVAGSPRGSAPPYGLADMAADAVAVLDALGWASAHVLGQSMGGMIAQQLAIDHPDRVRSLLLLMTASGERGHGLPTAEARAALLEAAPVDPDRWLAHRVATEAIWASPDHWSEEWVRAKGRAMLDHGVDPAGAVRQYRAVAASGSRDGALASLIAPTLVVHGAADTLIAPDGGRHLADVVPGARYLEIEGLGHDLPPALWRSIVDPVAAFVDRVERDDPAAAGSGPA